MTDREHEAAMAQVVDDFAFLTEVRPELIEYAHSYAARITDQERYLTGDLMEALLAIRIARPQFDVTRVAGFFG
jgi:hypothetical protein